MLKRMVWILFLAAIAIADVVLYRGSYLYEQAKDQTSDFEKKIVLLEMEQKYLPVNDLLYHELGKAYFDAGSNRLQDVAQRDSYFQKSYRNFIRSLTLNPLSASAHFDFAQALQVMNFLNLPFQESYFDEFKKAALLSGQNIQIYSEVGKIMFSRWPALSPDDKRFAVDIVHTVLHDKDPEKVDAFLLIWDFSVKDYGVLETILPVDADVIRRAARFFGERSLSRDVRLQYLTQAEALEFVSAKDEFFAGRSAYNALKIREAKAHFQTALAALQRIVFYQNLTVENPIDGLEYKNLLKSVNLSLAKCILEESRNLNEAMDHLYAYLRMEDQVSSVAEVETFLKERGLIEEKSGANFQDFGRFAYELFLEFKQNRYREIVQAGQVLERNLLVIPDGTKQDYARVLELVGDAYQKLNYLYESNNFYQKAIDMGRQDVALLLKMRKNYERLNDQEKMRMIDKSVEALLPFKDMRFPVFLLSKSEPFTQTITLDGRKFLLSLGFGEDLSKPFPLVSVTFNNQMIWEDYLPKKEISLVLPSNIGINSIKITTLNKPVTLQNMKMSNVEESKIQKNEDISLMEKR